MLSYIKGDIIDLADTGNYDLIAHGCNCFCTMGKGVALAIAKAYPDAARVDRDTAYGDRNKLGTYTYAVDDCHRLFIFNLYSQYRYGFATKRLKFFDYNAFEACLIRVKEFIINEHSQNFRILIPLIGSGYAGGSWKQTAPLIEKHWGDFDVTVCCPIN